MNNIDNLIDEYNQAKKQFQQKMKSEFKGFFKQFFEQNPEVTTVSWRQYTPYFNDGDACVFSCYAEYAFATNAEDYEKIRYGEYLGEDPENVWIDDADYGSINEELIPDHVVKNMEELRRILGKVPDEIYLELFGDHVTVYAHKEGFTVEDYKHD